ncbi:PASTA domain-containing protein [Singulisphaera sp. Ch08]|uniref:PASTA domain-containing protein n=1 Tax=Singulisphaera sp. Ch08 TaxID=3120278 RepID=A0AAU7CQ10_9BACT
MLKALPLSRRLPRFRASLLLGLLVSVLGSPAISRGEAIPTSAAVVVVDWGQSTVTVRATCPTVPGEGLLRVVFPDGQSASGLTVRREARGIVVSGPAQDLVAALSQGTRSLLIRGDGPEGREWRIDLPAVELDPRPTSHRYPKFDEGIVLLLPVYGLLPGFSVRHSSGPEAPERTLSVKHGTLPRFSDVYSSNGSRPLVRVILPFPQASDEITTDRFAIVNPDGSRSTTIEVKRTGDTVVPPAYATAKARPRPVARKVVVPGTDFLEVGEAIRVVREAGLVPVVVDVATLRPVEAPALESLKASKAVVIRQGIEADETLLEGESLMLGVGTLPPSGPEIPSSKKLYAALDPGDELGFVALPGRPETVGVLVDRAIDESTLAVGAIGAATEEPERLAIGRDPGINLDPSMTGDDLRDAALNRLILRSVGEALVRKEAAGPVGRAVQAAVDAHETALGESLRRGDSPKAVPVAQVLDTVVDSLSLSVSEKDRTAIVSGWVERRAGGAPSREALDENGNGLIADDVALSLIAGLFKTQAYNPAKAAQVVVDALGQLLLMFERDGKGGDPSSSPPLVLNGGLVTKPGPKGDPLAKKPANRATPNGPATVTESSAPDRVRIPTDLVGLTVDQAHRKLTALDLSLDRLDSLFNTDAIVGSTPKPSTWVKPKTAVSVSIERKVPKLVGQTWEQATATLGRWKLTSHLLDDISRPSDVVAEQEPEAGEPVAAGGEVRLRLERVVPSVVGQYGGNGVTALREAEFVPKFARGLSRWDTVVSQDPAGNSRSRLKGEIVLTLRRPIPDLRQKNFAEAEKLLEDYRLKVDTPANFQPDETLFVADQEPPPGPGPTLALDDDGELKAIALIAGRKLPDYRDQSLDDVRASLDKLDLKVDDRDGFLDEIPMRILEQSPVATSIVALGSTVTLKVGPVGPLVPKVTEVALKVAIEKLEAVGLKAAYPNGSFLTDLVVTQDPLPYGPDSPTWLPNGSPVALKVQTQVPNVVGLSVEQAQQTMRSWDLHLTLPEKAFSPDRVVEQDPVAGTYVDHKSDVSAVIKLVVPDVRRQLLSVARQILQNWDLEDSHEGEAFDDDLVVAQVPAPGALMDHGSRISLQLYVAVPEVRGMTLARATEVLQGKDLAAEVANGNALNEDIVRGQSTAPRQYLAHGSTVTLGPVVARVPNLVGHTLADASEILRDREKFQPQHDEDLQAGDIVTGQNPEAGAEAERGSVVGLGALVQVPSLVRRTVEDAADVLNNAAGDLRLNFSPEGRNGDTLIAQNPVYGTWVNPRTTITVLPGFVVPELVGRTEQDAIDILDSLGVRAIAGGIRSQPTEDRDMVGRQQVGSQSQPAGTLVSRDTPIEYVVVNFVEAKIRVPNVVGVATLDEVRERIEAAGLRFRTLNAPENGPVFRQVPVAGTLVDRDDVILVAFPPRRQMEDNSK